MTMDGGATWSDISGDLPRAPVSGLVVVGPTLYAATDVGVFFTTDGGLSWLALGRGLPNVPVTDLRYHAPSATLFAATFGRGIWKVGLPA
jgi:photosystem II stability/assembly factor-like uncharacterized protein